MFFDAEAGLKPELKGCWEGNAPPPPPSRATLKFKSKTSLSLWGHTCQEMVGVERAEEAGAREGLNDLLCVQKSGSPPPLQHQPARLRSGRIRLAVFTSTR